MGGTETKTYKNTDYRIVLFREVFQAGDFVEGKIEIEIGDEDYKNLKRYDQGADLEIEFSGNESTWWTTNRKHDPTLKTKQKQLVSAKNRRSSSN